MNAMSSFDLTLHRPSRGRSPESPKPHFHASGLGSPETQDCQWRVKTFDNLRAVEEFLDRLDACGITERRLTLVDENTFEVRWQGTS